MRLTCIICTINLIVLSVLCGVYAFTGYDLLSALFLGNAVALRSYLALCAVSALFEAYALIIFKPFRGLK